LVFIIDLEVTKGCPALAPHGVEKQQDFTHPGKSGEFKSKSRLIACANWGLMPGT